ncbi:S8 family serine peptidase [Neobacillus niacini]|uniref:S8 family serine peptidase n=1 Tax=Neobacillus niacini TaxID=86668 RepID=UPI0025594CCA|nr:S8 family serine peptidase [Neobacillus niacini]
MKLLLAFILALQTSITLTNTHTRGLNHPPIPKTTEKTVAIVMLDQPQSDQEIKQLLQPYKHIKLRRIFQEALNGFSVEGSPEAIDQLAKQATVTHVSPVSEYRVGTEESVKIIGGHGARGIFSKKNERLTGKGVTVAVIDTGVDYTHPDLRRSYAGGHDLVDNDNDPMETLTTGHATIHGTHVAGIIAGNGKIMGVAPEAKILAYRALGPGGGGTTEQVLAAIEQAIKDKVDIMNLSLGNSINGPDLPISQALDNAVDKGIVAVAASGNSGPNVWTVGSPGTSTKAISVGASTPTMGIPHLLIEGIREPVVVQPMEGSADWNIDRSLQLVDGGFGKRTELKNVQGKMVLMKRGQITFQEKAENAREAGARAVIVANNMSGSFIGNLDSSTDIPIGAITKREGEILRKELQAKELGARATVKEERDRMADFSSRGPVTDTWEIKPDLVAPGVAINSTVPGGYLSLQGTSMAAPHVAGACALIKQAHPDWSPEQIKAALMNTAKPLVKGETGTNGGTRPKIKIDLGKKDPAPTSAPYYRTYEQGAGRIQVDEAIKTQSLVTPGSIRFGKFTDSSNIHTAVLHVENVGGKPQRYSFEVPQHVAGLEWRMPLSFTLGPGETRDVKVELAVDPLVFKEKIHDGFLKLQAGSAIIHVPFLYVLEEPGYPRIMGFDFGEGDQPGTYRYEVYVPGGAEEFGIALFDPNDYRFLGFLDTSTNVKKGLIQKEFAEADVPYKGTFLAKVFAKKAGKEDFIETMIFIGGP